MVHYLTTRILFIQSNKYEEGEKEEMNKTEMIAQRTADSTVYIWVSRCSFFVSLLTSVCNEFKEISLVNYFVLER